jgi:hypothetical protein
MKCILFGSGPYPEGMAGLIKIRFIPNQSRPVLPSDQAEDRKSDRIFTLKARKNFMRTLPGNATMRTIKASAMLI